MTVNMLPGYEAWRNDPGGGIGSALEEFAHDVVIPDAREALSNQWPGGPNPPYGDTAQNNQRPFRRTGILMSSLQVEPAERDADGLFVQVIADVAYSVRLLDREYKFLPEKPYYRWVQMETV